MPVTVLPLTVQTLVEAEEKLTARPEVAVAESAPVPPAIIVGAVPKLVVWLALPIVMDCAVWVANL